MKEGKSRGGERGRDTGSLLAAISSYAPAPIYPPALRISRRLSRPFTTLRPSLSAPLSYAYFIYRSSDNVCTLTTAIGVTPLLVVRFG